MDSAPAAFDTPTKFGCQLVLTPVQAVMLQQAWYVGLASLMNQGWRAPGEWVQLSVDLDNALAPALSVVPVVPAGGPVVVTPEHG